ncbi:protein of unknown function [Methylocella tundrae]|uniref:Uncharacterized protein n=1 Tax=Methylocella tundrae TaxID=227605 RepID=A0A4V6IM70_METTU|nr:protein of unknown function [Methylocella tundrae]
MPRPVTTTLRMFGPGQYVTPRPANSGGRFSSYRKDSLSRLSSQPPDYACNIKRRSPFGES